MMVTFYPFFKLHRCVLLELFSLYLLTTLIISWRYFDDRICQKSSLNSCWHALPGISLTHCLNLQLLDILGGGIFDHCSQREHFSISHSFLMEVAQTHLKLSLTSIMSSCNMAPSHENLLFPILLPPLSMALVH